MGDSTRDTFIDGIDTHFVPMVLALDRAVLAACPDFDTRIYYRMLTYALAGDFRHWICAISVHKKAVCLRFLFGVLLDDPQGVLRAGTGILRTIDFVSVEEVDAQLVADYVNEAVTRLDYFKAHERDL
ncbi:MAG: DUF1801 domain-containing protein [Anaerolineae bacterium]